MKQFIRPVSSGFQFFFVVVNHCLKNIDQYMTGYTVNAWLIFIHSGTIKETMTHNTELGEIVKLFCIRLKISSVIFKIWFLFG